MPTDEEYLWPMRIALFLALGVSVGVNQDLPQYSSAAFES